MEADVLRTLSTRYAEAVDALDGSAFAALFTADGELWVPDRAQGHLPAVCFKGTEALERIPDGLARYHSTRHEVGEATYDIDGDSGWATGEVHGIAHHLRVDSDGSDSHVADSHVGDSPVADGPAMADLADPPGTDVIWYIRYVDDYVRSDLGWRISRRLLHLDRVEERALDHLGPSR